MRPIKTLSIIAITLATITGAAAFIAYRHLGYTPREIFDHLERRMIGHPRLEVMAKPPIAALRTWLQEPALAERLRQPFAIPKPAGLSTPAADITAETTPQEVTGGRVLRVGPRESFQSINAAARHAKDGDIVEIQAGEYFADVAVWRQAKLTLRGVGGMARLNAAGASAEGKAIWVIRNGDFLIENIEFFGAAVADKNGAGIRMEGGRLRLRNCLFYGNESGLIATPVSSDATVQVEDSEFAYNGAGDGLSHAIYIGYIKEFSIRGSYIHHNNRGHAIKSRAANNTITYNRLTDEAGGRASYEIDLPNGGIAHITGNIIQQSRETENSTLIRFGEEGYHWPSNSLYLVNNTLVNDHPYGGAFLRVAPGAQKVLSANNLLAGWGGYHVPGALESINDIHADWEMFRQPQRHDYRIEHSDQTLTIPARQPIDTPELLPLYPTQEYLHPRQVRPLAARPRHAGALQH